MAGVPGVWSRRRVSGWWRGPLVVGEERRSTWQPSVESRLTSRLEGRCSPGVLTGVAAVGFHGRVSAACQRHGAMDTQPCVAISLVSFLAVPSLP